MILASVAAHACECSASRPASCRWGQPGGIAFLGTVVNIENPAREDDQGHMHDDGSGVAHYRFRIDERFFGVNSGEIDIYSGRGGGDCSYHFKPGEQYLVVPYKQTDGRLFATYCNETRVYRTDNPLITLLRTMRDHKPVASVFGSLEKALAPYAGPYQTIPLPNVKIRLTRNGDAQRFEAVTASDGIYQIYDLPAGTYQVTADLPTGLELIGEVKPVPALKFPANACYELPLQAMPATRIHGHLLDERGNVVIGAVELLQGTVYSPGSSGPWDISGKDGFEFKNIVAGSYILVFNKDNALDPSAPYPRTFYPGVVDPAKAVPVTISNGQVINVDIHLSGGAPVRQLNVSVTWANAAPVGKQQAFVFAKPINGEEAVGERVEPGIYRLNLLQGVRYAIWANVYCGEQCDEKGCRGSSLDTPKTHLDVSESSPTSLTLVFPSDACPK
jgi:hypothetical protein